MPMEPVLFLEGETLHVSGGGGGHGDPLDRAPRDAGDIREERLQITPAMSMV